MPKQKLTGTLEEQCEFLYQLAQEKMSQGNYTGAVHALDEIVTHAPTFRDAVALLQTAKQKKAQQQRLLFSALGGGALFIGFGTVLQLPNDWLFLLFATVGAFVGFGIANLIEIRKDQVRKDQIQ